MIQSMKEYRVSSPFGKRKSPISGQEEFHTGIDLVKPPFSMIHAFVPGVVVHARMGQSGTGVGGFGVTVIIQDKYDCLHKYAHLTDCCVQVGQRVQQGQAVGRQGNTGQSAGQHLHYEVRKNGSSFGFGKHVDPVKYLDDYFAKEQKSSPQPAPNPVDKPTDSCNIEVNGKRLAVTGILRDGKALLPVRAVAEAAGKGSLVGWCDTAKKVLLAGNVLESTELVSGTGYAWSKEIGAALGRQVEWDGQSKTVKMK